MSNGWVGKIITCCMVLESHLLKISVIYLWRNWKALRTWIISSFVLVLSMSI